MPRTRRLVLVGGGHSHIELLRRAARAPIGGDIVLVTPHRTQLYTGCRAAHLRGTVSDEQVTVDLAALCLEAGARFIESHADRVEAALPEAARDSVVVHTPAGPVSGDVCSLDIGSITAGMAIPGVREHAFPVRLHQEWQALVRIVRELVRAGDRTPFAVTIVGGGAGGIEIALALSARARASGQALRATLITGTRGLAENLGPRFGARAQAVLARHGVRVLTGRMVVGVGSDAVTLDDGSAHASALTVWATGPAAPPLLARSGLPVDREGFLRVDATLRAVDGRPVFGGGDCITLVESPWAAKSGAQAMRQAPVLLHNLRAVLDGGRREPILYGAPSDPLTIIDTSDGKALLYWRGSSMHSRVAQRLKRRIDSRWMRRLATLSAARGADVSN